MAARKNKLPVVLTEEERDQLESLARRRKTHQALALRAKIVLRCAEGKSHLEISNHLNVSNVTVGKWRKRFLSKRLDGLHDEPRPGQPRKISDALHIRVGNLARLTGSRFVIQSIEPLVHKTFPPFANGDVTDIQMIRNLQMRLSFCASKHDLGSQR